MLFSQKHPFNPSKFLMTNKYWSFGFSQGGLKAQQHIAQGKRSDTLGYVLLPFQGALSAVPQQKSQASLAFCIRFALSLCIKEGV